MRQLLFLFGIAILLLSCSTKEGSDADQTTSSTPENSALTWPAGLPVYDHIVIVVEENKDYDEIIGNPKASYINNVLEVEGAHFTQAYAQEHLSQGNYYWLFSGDNQSVGFVDKIPNEENNPNYPFTTSNLGQQLISKGLSFKGYAESLPSIGSTVDTAGPYARKHAPWISFANVPNGTTVETSSNLRFLDFPDSANFHTLPTVAFVIPNLDNDMHNCKSTDCADCANCIENGDRWLRENLDAYYQWAKENNSLLILTFDENNDKRWYLGLTNPAVNLSSDPCAGEAEDSKLRELCIDMQNQIVTIFAGAHIKPGDYPEGKGITHVNILRTIEAMYGLPRSGAQQANAVGAGILDTYIITDVFETIQ